MYVKFNVYVGLLVLLFESTASATEAPNNTVYSTELSNEITPCRSRVLPCVNGAYRCSSQDEYYRSIFGFQQGCPIEYNSTATPPPATTCTLANNTCAFVEGAPTCVSWLRDCNIEYSCTTEADFSAATENDETACSFPASPPPTPNAICIPVNDTCEWHNPCRIWQNWCGGEYRCGSEAQYAAFINGPQPDCIYPTENAPEPVPAGECVYQDGQCVWSECTAWLSPCQTSWVCGSNYEYRVSQAQPLPPCPNPGEYFVPPPMPGLCDYVLESGQCQFHGEPECTGGLEYQSCGTACPRTCDNYQLDFVDCILVCVPGCFCPDNTVLHEGECISSSLCPGENPCNLIDCGEGYECLIYEETGEGYCSPNCEDLNPCGPQEQCVITAVNCFRAPCPGVLSCEGGCTGGKEWQECGTACPLTCDNYNTPLVCTLQCVVGCFCPNGKVELDGACVEPSMCSECNKCRYGEVCSVITYGDWHQVTCKGPTAGYCYREDASACPNNSRCLTHNAIGSNFCLESCYIQNGGCSDNEVCYYERVDEECNPLLESCFKTTCTDTTSGDCPFGREHTECPNCIYTCETYLELEPVACPATGFCSGSCECPQGMVIFRDRCVDPLECYTLMTEPSLNPLPQPEDVLLVRMSLVGVSQETFDKYRFRGSVVILLEGLGFHPLYVSVYAVFVEDGNIVIVLKLQGEAVVQDRANIVVELKQNREELENEVASVSEVNTLRATRDDDDGASTAVVAGSVVAVVVICSLLLLALVIVVTLTVRSRKKRTHLKVPVDEKEKLSDNLSFVRLVSKEAEKDVS